MTDRGRKSTLRLATTHEWWVWLHSEFGKVLRVLELVDD